MAGHRTQRGIRTGETSHVFLAPHDFQFREATSALIEREAGGIASGLQFLGLSTISQVEDALQARRRGSEHLRSLG